MSADIAVVGGGVVGSAIAWRLAQAGAAVTVYDDTAAGRASTVAAGMLAPASEAQLDNPHLLRLSIAAARRWPQFAADLADQAEQTDPDDHIGYRACGTLLVAMSAADQADIDRYRDLYQREGIEIQRWDGERCRTVEPLLSHRVNAGLFAPGDHQVDPRRTLAALIRAGAAAGVRRVAEPVTNLSELKAGRVVLAAGTWSGRLAELPIRPVHGQVLRLHAPADDANHIGRSIRAVNRGRSVYLVPRSNGEVVVGASSHELGFDTAARVGDTVTLLRDAVDVVPELTEYRLIETNVGLRPGTPDNAPLLGPIGDGRVVVATGHFRNGILLAPITADLITRYLTTGAEPVELRTFNAERFA